MKKVVVGKNEKKKKKKKKDKHKTSIGKEEEKPAWVCRLPERI